MHWFEWHYRENVAGQQTERANCKHLTNLCDCKLWNALTKFVVPCFTIIKQTTHTHRQLITGTKLWQTSMPFLKLFKHSLLHCQCQAFDCFYPFTKSHTGTYFHSEERVQSICEKFLGTYIFNINECPKKVAWRYINTNNIKKTLNFCTIVGMNGSMQLCHRALCFTFNSQLSVTSLTAHNPFKYAVTLSPPLQLTAVQW